MRSGERVVLRITVALLLLFGTASAENIAVFSFSPFVEPDTAATVHASLEALGHTVDPLFRWEAADWTAAGAANDLILIPSVSAGNSLYGIMEYEDRIALRSYVSTGGGLILMSSGSPGGDDLVLLNYIFNMPLLVVGGSDPTTLDPAEAAGTPFAGGPTSLPAHNDVMAISSLPAGALALYQNSFGVSTSVMAASYGSGQIVRLGWGWHGAAPLGPVDDEWSRVLDNSIAYVSTATAPPIPEPSTWLLVALGGAGLFCHRRRCKAA